MSEKKLHDYDRVPLLVKHCDIMRIFCLDLKSKVKLLNNLVGIFSTTTLTFQKIWIQYLELEISYSFYYKPKNK